MKFVMSPVRRRRNMIWSDVNGSMDGIMSASSWWLNGRYLASVDGYHMHDVAGWLAIAWLEKHRFLYAPVIFLETAFGPIPI